MTKHCGKQALANGDSATANQQCPDVVKPQHEFPIAACANLYTSVQQWRCEANLRQAMILRDGSAGYNVMSGSDTEGDEQRLRDIVRNFTAQCETTTFTSVPSGTKVKLVTADMPKPVYANIMNDLISPIADTDDKQLDVNGMCARYELVGGDSDTCTMLKDCHLWGQSKGCRQGMDSATAMGSLRYVSKGRGVVAGCTLADLRAARRDSEDEEHQFDVQDVMMWLSSVTSNQLLDVAKFPTLFIAKIEAGDWIYIPPSFCLVEHAVEAMVGVKVLVPHMSVPTRRAWINFTSLMQSHPLRCVITAQLEVEGTTGETDSEEEAEEDEEPTGEPKPPDCFSLMPAPAPAQMWMPAPPEMVGGDNQKIGAGEVLKGELVVSGSSAAPPKHVEPEVDAGKPTNGLPWMSAPPEQLAGVEEQTIKDGEVPMAELVVSEASGNGAAGSSAAPPKPVEREVDTGKPTEGLPWMPAPPEQVVGVEEQTIKEGEVMMGMGELVVPEASGKGAARELVVPEASGSSAAPPKHVEPEVDTGKPPPEQMVDQKIEAGEVLTGELAAPGANGSSGSAAPPDFDLEAELEDEMVAADDAEMKMGGEGKGGEGGGAAPPGSKPPVTPPARAKRASPVGVSPAGKKARTRGEVAPPGRYADLGLFLRPGPQKL